MTSSISALLRAAAVAAIVGLAPAAFAEDVRPFADTSRLVSIGGSLTEIIYALGEEGRLVARDSTGLYPEAATKLPDVGYMRALSPEGALSVNPTALLVVEGSGPPEALEVLSRGSVPYITVPDGYSHDGILTKVRTVGAALGVPGKAETLATELDAQLKAAEAATKDIPADQRKRVLFVISAKDGKIRAGGSGTAANGIIGLAGAVNAVGEMQNYQTLSDEAVLTANPDVILMMENGGGGVTDEELRGNAALAATPALKNNAIIRIDGAYLLGFGPRTPAAILELARDLYGDKVAAPRCCRRPRQRYL